MEPWADPKTYAHKWIDIHSLSANIKTKSDNTYILKSICIIIDSIHCNKCREHAMAYLKENNPKKSFDVKDENGVYVGLFNYFYDFHNTVNIRIGKPYMNYETAKEMYYTKSEACEDFCGI